MNLLHAKEKEQFRKLFSQERVENFDDRFKVLEAFLSTENHVTSDDLHALLISQGVAVTLDFVRDTLKMLSRMGFAVASRFDNGVVRYEHRHLGDHHDHMICTKCRKIIEFRDERIEAYQMEISERHGFHMLRHRMELYGLCAACMKERSRHMPLTMAKPGEKLVVREIAGGREARLRLLTLGLRLGDAVEVITNNGQGQLAISAGQKRFVLGRSLAQKIVVEPASP
jgi:Fur family transcriptional regulator, ferric uptake regulator